VGGKVGSQQEKVVVSLQQNKVRRPLKLESTVEQVKLDRRGKGSTFQGATSITPLRGKPPAHVKTEREKISSRQSIWGTIGERS